MLVPTGSVLNLCTKYMLLKTFFKSMVIMVTCSRFFRLEVSSLDAFCVLLFLFTSLLLNSTRIMKRPKASFCSPANSIPYVATQHPSCRFPLTAPSADPIRSAASRIPSAHGLFLFLFWPLRRITLFPSLRYSFFLLYSYVRVYFSLLIRVKSG